MKFGLSLLVFSLVVLPSSYANNRVGIAASNVTNYLKKPTGQYEVGFKDFYWVNQDLCPDFNFNGKNQDDFSPSNIKHCHEIVSRIYYPTEDKAKVFSPYYQSSITLLRQAILGQRPHPLKNQMDQVAQLKSFSIKNAAIINHRQFPVAIFISGLGQPAESQENFITNLVSHGYVVIGMNTPFINVVTLENGHEVPAPASMTYSKNENKWITLQSDDLAYVYHKIHKLHGANDLFSSMNINHIGVYGVSLGGRVLANTVHRHPNWFQAAVALDTAADSTGASFKSFAIPYMHEISPRRRLFIDETGLTQFTLGKNGYLVGMAKSEKNLDDLSYSYHQSFDDLSTLQYLPIVQAIFSDHQKQIKEKKLYVKLLSHDLSPEEIKTIDKPTYVFVKKAGRWSGALFDQHARIVGINVYMTKDLIKAMENLPNQLPEQLTDAEIGPIKKIVRSIDNLWEGVATGDGWKITEHINVYLEQFFDMYLKGEPNPKLEKCIPLTNNSFIDCGPGVF